ncbi:hypothetical protein F4780DRAFT_743901 [Xylariomycetidae sp. FL0641]|nr:hypothetical protein F4780DRAFT_743901 [Xylariomycetidae sp. FL0641]
MAVRPGEENVATLFGDVHYFYAPPTTKPPHHRFDKGSYVYLFENANDRRARIEIANQPGTDEQAAFDGFLDRTHVRYSYKQQCLVSITVEGVPGPPIEPSQWHLPTYDPRNENMYHYKIYSLDIYFWTQSDALQFVNGVRRVLPPQQVEVADEPGPPSHHYGQSQDMNPLVQKLEKAAISSSSRSNSQQPGVPSFAPPPTMEFAPPPTSGSDGKRSSAQSFAPMAYNPAAPAAPEQIQHREKTPPPPEEDGQDPLAAAVARENAPYGATNFSAPPGGPGLPGPPPPPSTHPGLTSPGLVSPGLQSPGIASPGIASPGFPPTQYARMQRAVTIPAPGMTTPGFASPYGAQFPGSPGFAPQPATPGFAPPHPGTPGFAPHHPPGTPGFAPQPGTPGLQSPGLPPGGYAQYNYTTAAPQQQQQQQGNPGDWGLHQQLYRPTEQEHAAKYGVYKPKVERESKLGQGAERLEKGVTGMLKKFEKKFG